MPAYTLDLKVRYFVHEGVALDKEALHDELIERLPGVIPDPADSRDEGAVFLEALWLNPEDEEETA